MNVLRTQRSYWIYAIAALMIGAAIMAWVSLYPSHAAGYDADLDETKLTRDVSAPAVAPQTENTEWIRVQIPEGVDDPLLKHNDLYRLDYGMLFVIPQKSEDDVLSYDLDDVVGHDLSA